MKLAITIVLIAGMVKAMTETQIGVAHTVHITETNKKGVFENIWANIKVRTSLYISSCRTPPPALNNERSIKCY